MGAAPAPTAPAAGAASGRATRPAAPGAAEGARQAPTGAGVSLTIDELAEASGMTVRELRELEGFGLLESHVVGDAAYYDADALQVARTAGGFLRHGIEARHLRSYKVAVDREAGLFEQIILPLLKQRNPEAHRRASQIMAELIGLGEAMRGTLLHRELPRPHRLRAAPTGGAVATGWRRRHHAHVAEPPPALRCTTGMRKARLLTLLALVLGLALLALPGPAPAGAGGWAVTSLDPLPTPVPGEPVEVGFTVLQHGRTPVDAAAPGMENAEFGFIVTSPGGEVTEFAARPDGVPGHFVGEVTFPTAGTYSWAVRQGYFGPWELGELVVEPPSGASPAPAPAAPAPALAGDGDGDGRAPLAVRLLVPGVAAVALALLAIDVTGVARRGRRPAPTAA